jgi:hypothetical protein
LVVARRLRSLSGTIGLGLLVLADSPGNDHVEGVEWEVEELCGLEVVLMA